MKDENLIKVLKNINLNECEATSQENIFILKNLLRIGFMTMMEHISILRTNMNF